MLSENFIESMLTFWKAHGDEALEKTLKQNPAALVATYARLVPKDFQINVTGGLTITHELSADQRRKIAESWIVSQQAAKATLPGETEKIIEGQAETVLECKVKQGETVKTSQTRQKKTSQTSQNGNLNHQKDQNDDSN